ncbi:MAG: Rpn family recombination-promoting nuclease/putative transposase [Spirochaetaceae bacterium]|jgi:hypothetical protein|nr:Rpn family recombination-promoting nuclease/putative transposase [Spirochaetaceae bacterium]
MSVNAKYKDSVFSLLFNNAETLRELYGALEGIKLPHDIEININTLKNVLFKGKLNDVSFVFGTQLVIIMEHQSTINPNMPLRILIYISKIYEKLTASKNVYGSKKLTVPRPEFIVLYNGKDAYPDEQTLKLSDLFADVASLGISREQMLELEVKVYNINVGHNEDKLKQCRTLEDYSIFIAKAREYEAKAAAGRKITELTVDEREKAMTQAIQWCINHNTLEEFLKANSSEVINMLLEEWNLDTALKVEREEGREEGKEEGREEERQNTLFVQHLYEEAQQQYEESQREIERLRAQLGR